MFGWFFYRFIHLHHYLDYHQPSPTDPPRHYYDVSSTPPLNCGITFYCHFQSNYLLKSTPLHLSWHSLSPYKPDHNSHYPSSINLTLNQAINFV